MTEPLTTLFIEALAPSLRRFVREEVQRAEWAWRWRTPEQAGELLGITGDAVRKRIKRGELPHSVLGGRIYLDVMDLDQAIKEGRVRG